VTGSEPLVLVVEDEPQMRRFLRTSLSSHGFRVVEAASGSQMLAMATSHAPALILLDLGLPDGDGIELTTNVRQWSRVPIIVISARETENDKVSALDAGADDYLTKPFGVGELLARMRAAFRRASDSSGDQGSSVLDLGGLRIDIARRETTVGDQLIRLTPIEWKLLVYLARNAGKVLTHRQILHHVWGPLHAAANHYVRVYMAELRKKIERDPTRPVWLITEQGVGYRMRDHSAR
jgi:two-component system KDP operon response regulator KdpE